MAVVVMLLMVIILYSILQLTMNADWIRADMIAAVQEQVGTGNIAVFSMQCLGTLKHD